MTTNSFVSFLEGALSWTSKRQQALAANLANIDTPGYRAKDYSFEEQLSTMELAASSDKHIVHSEQNSQVRMFEVETNVVNPNGNNVDLDRDITELSQNGLQYITLIQALNHKLRMLRSSIDEGGRR